MRIARRVSVNIEQCMLQAGIPPASRMRPRNFLLGEGADIYPMDTNIIRVSTQLLYLCSYGLTDAIML
jgi:hypothetical protein